MADGDVYGRREWTLGPGSVFVSRPGDVYRYKHMRRLEPDTCFCLRFSAPSTDELTSAFDRLPLVVPITNRLAFLRLQVGSLVADDADLSLDALACDLLDAAADARNDSPRLHRPQQLKWYGSRVNVAREAMEANPAGPHSLWRLASRVAMSPFLFARVFRELMEVPPHKYLVRLRLQRAHATLESGMSVTDACYAAGFNNLSHFIRSFRAHFGFVPSKLKSRAAADVRSRQP